MRSFGTFVAAAAILALAVILPSVEPMVETLAAISFVTAVAYGFALHPRTEVFYVRTTARMHDDEANMAIEHDQLAVRVETARLWLLFVPTALSVAFLVLTAAQGKLWNFSLLETFVATRAFGLWSLLRLPLWLVGAALWIWASERRVLRDAEVCSARSYKLHNGRVGFQFVTDKGRYSGGDDFFFGLAKPWEVATLVFYDRNDIDLCKIGMGFLFHRIVVLGRGLTELDHQTTAMQHAIRDVLG